MSGALGLLLDLSLDGQLTDHRHLRLSEHGVHSHRDEDARAVGRPSHGRALRPLPGLRGVPAGAVYQTATRSG